ncbi:hypothetical protein [Nocardia yunnanensis]|uniref:hypothetical protein n=1 Tax=Nocardia yunnanensis TaxID=2382165 RepID=UPI0013C4D093|nr:hypothetical protein [Nocardia yunnanensis]
MLINAKSPVWKSLSRRSMPGRMPGEQGRRMVNGGGRWQLPQRNRNHVNRDKVLLAAAEAARSTNGNSIIVLTGLSGIGKSATALELGHRMSRNYPDGQLLCSFPDCGPADSYFSDAITDLLLGLGDRPEDIPDRRDALHGRYRDRTAELRLLIIADNVKTKAQIRWLCPADGESLLVVAGTAAATDLSGGGVSVFELEQLAESDSRELLCRIAGVDRVAAEPEAAQQILRMCDNIPFALCIAGGMLALHPHRSVASLVERLSDEGRRSAALSLEEMFGAAYDSVSALAQRCYRIFGLHGHAGRLSVESVAAAAGASRGEVYSALMELTDLYLLTDRDGWFHALELVRVHARSVHTSVGEREDAERALLEHFDRRLWSADELLAPARPWRRLLFPDDTSSAGEFTDVASARAWISGNLPNLDAAARHAEIAGQPEVIIRWCTLLWSFHEKDKRLDTMRAMHLRAISAAERAGSSALASLLLTQMGFLHYWLRELQDATAQFERAARLAVSLQPGAAALQLEASAVEGAGLSWLARNDIAAARVALRRNYQLARALGDPRRIALAAMHGGKAEGPARALPLFSEAAALFGGLASDEAENLAKVAMWRGHKLTEIGELATAQAEFDSAEAVMRDRGRPFDQAEILVFKAELATRAGCIDEARELYHQARSRYAELCFAESVRTVDAALTALE